MSEIEKHFISASELLALKKEHNLVEKDGSVTVNKTYADVVKINPAPHGMFERFQPSDSDLEKFRKANPYVTIFGGSHICEINPNDNSNLDFKLPPKDTLYFDN